LHTGKKFALLFDQLILFATNFPPEEVMDLARLRLVYYRMEINAPAVLELKEIFQRICDSYYADFSEKIMNYLLEAFYARGKIPSAGYHPKLVVEHAIAARNYPGTPARIARGLFTDALNNRVVLPSQRTAQE
jgi:hypothetical protein